MLDEVQAEEQSGEYQVSSCLDVKKARTLCMARTHAKKKQDNLFVDGGFEKRLRTR